MTDFWSHAPNEDDVWSQLRTKVSRAVNALKRFDKNMTIERLVTWEEYDKNGYEIFDVRGLGWTITARLCHELECLRLTPAWKASSARYLDFCREYDKIVGTDELTKAWHEVHKGWDAKR